MSRVNKLIEGIKRKGTALIQEFCDNYFQCHGSLYYFTSALGGVFKWLLVLKFLSYQMWGGQLNLEGFF